MTPAARLSAAIELIDTIDAQRVPAAKALKEWGTAHRYAGSGDRAAISGLIWDVLRRRSSSAFLMDADTPRARVLGMLKLERGMDADSIAALCDGSRFAPEPLTEAERKALASRTLAAAPPHIAGDYPEWLDAPLAAVFGDDRVAEATAMASRAPLDLRVNTLKARRDEVQQTLQAAGLDVAATPYSPWGLRVAGRPAVNTMPAFRDGLFEVQDEGSQLLAALLDARRGEMVVDFCAGAGGKTLAIGAAMRNTGRLYAFDTSGHRLHALKPRLARSGLSNVHTVQIAHERDERVKRLAGKVDRVLVDAPCSGLGTLRRNPDLKWRQSPATVAQLRQQQATILQAAATLVKPGGRLVYATCSLLDLENEDVARTFEAARVQFEPVAASEALAQARIVGADELVQGPWLKLSPQRHCTDGFFAAVWQRKG